MKPTFLILTALLAAPAYGQLELGTAVENIYWSDGDSGRINGTKFRLADMDTPEIFSVDCGGDPESDEEKAARERHRSRGFAAKEYMVEATRDAVLTVTGNVGSDRYGRYVVSLSKDGQDLKDMAIQSGHAASWKHMNGRAVEDRPNWCE